MAIGTRSRVFIKSLSGLNDKNYEFRCAQPLKRSAGDIKEYTHFLPPLYPQVKLKLTKWFRYLTDMGLPIQFIPATDGNNSHVLITDPSFLNNEFILLWAHSLIRAGYEEEGTFDDYIQRVYKLRENSTFNKYDNYQLLQLVASFNFPITRDSNAYTHFMFEEASKTGKMIMKLQTMEETLNKFNTLSSLMNINRLASTYMSADKVIGTQLVSTNLKLSTSIARTSDNARIMLRLFKKHEDKVGESGVVVCSKIGMNDGLIKGNMYKIDESINRSINKNIKVVIDAWGIKVESRHFKKI